MTSILPNKVITWRLQAIFTDYALKTPPYTGRLVLRFERSKLPRHTKRRFAVLRVLKILDPIKPIDPDYDQRLPVPLEGQLLLSVRGLPRSYNLDSKFTQVLGDLPSIPDDEPDL
ncbi:hypothetical protein C0993_010833 [Termitomyces sp. T159_Od127]|nr:hypothetical protein C0993_010833 [Termitomyces sp. T159_Od127]